MNLPLTRARRKLTPADILPLDEYARIRNERRREINYNPLIPQGRELVATVMFEIEDARHRARVLAQLGGIEDHAFIEVPIAEGGERIRGKPDPTRENTSPDGKASAVQFIRFPFTDQQIAAFERPGARVLVGFEHPNYGHQATLPEPVRAALADDFD